MNLIYWKIISQINTIKSNSLKKNIKWKNGLNELKFNL